MDYFNDISVDTVKANYIVNRPKDRQENSIVNGLWFDPQNKRIMVSRNLNEENPDDVKWCEIATLCDISPSYYYYTEYKYYDYLVDVEVNQYYNYKYDTKYDYSYDYTYYEYTDYEYIHQDFVYEYKYNYNYAYFYYNNQYHYVTKTVSSIVYSYITYDVSSIVSVQ